MKPIPQKIVRILAIEAILLFALLDQFSKWYVIERLFRPVSFDAHEAGKDFFPWLTTMGQTQFPFYRHGGVTSFFDLVMVWNKGVSFGMFTSTHAFMPYVLMIMALAMTVFFLSWLWRAPNLLTALPISLIVSGALSNVWDRARFGAVADFLDFHIGSMHWPAFNIADSCIVIGVAGLALNTLLSDRENRKLSASKPTVELP